MLARSSKPGGFGLLGRRLSRIVLRRPDVDELNVFDLMDD